MADQPRPQGNLDSLLGASGPRQPKSGLDELVEGRRGHTRQAVEFPETPGVVQSGASAQRPASTTSGFALDERRQNRRELFQLGGAALLLGLTSIAVVERDRLSTLLDGDSGPKPGEIAQRYYTQGKGEDVAASDEEKNWLERTWDSIKETFSGTENQAPTPEPLSHAAQEKIKEYEEKMPSQTDPITQNQIWEGLMDQSIDEPIVRKVIDGQEIYLKEGVMKRFLAAAEELKQKNIRLSIGPDSHLRDNETQYQMSLKYPIVGPIVSSYHLLGQALDIQNAKPENETSHEIRQVMKKYGFRWGVKPRAKKGLWNRVKRTGKRIQRVGGGLFGGAMSVDDLDSANALVSDSLAAQEIDDRAHFDMPKDTYEKTQDAFEKLQK